MNHQDRVEFFDALYQRLFARYGKLACPLIHADAFQLLVAVVLSGQCRDDRVNLVTPALFERWPDADKLARAANADVEAIIKPCGLFRNKAANLIALSRQLTNEFHGEVPRTIEELTTLPGVGRKTANVVLGDAFDLPGFPVDTHVIRLLNRFGAVDTENPEKIESSVTACVPEERWANLSHMVIRYGRDVCHARNPKCESCILRDLCPAVNGKTKRK